jgi:hypothetical protein
MDKFYVKVGIRDNDTGEVTECCIGDDGRYHAAGLNGYEFDSITKGMEAFRKFLLAFYACQYGYKEVVSARAFTNETVTQVVVTIV